MQTILYYIYDEESRDKGPVYQEMMTGTVEEAIGWCLKVKEEQKITPVGFEMIRFEFDLDDKLYEEERKRYFFNGKIISKDNVPYNWNYSGMLRQFPKLVYVNDNFCYPFNDETDNMLKINI